LHEFVFVVNALRLFTGYCSFIIILSRFHPVPAATRRLLQIKRLFPFIRTIAFLYRSTVWRYRAMQGNFQRSAA